MRGFLLRRLLNRLRIDDDVVRHLSTFQRLGETLEVESPGEMLTIGARTLFRAVRTRGAAQIRPDWLFPWWLERQLDPASPDFVPRGHLPFSTNVTNRNWTMVGNVGSVWEAVVDPRGLVTPWFDGWSLDWWVGADDRWHIPARETSVRQRLLAGTPVVETAMRVPGGDAVQRVYAVAGAEEFAVVEIENQSPVPFAVAFAVRPYNPEGLAVLERISLEGDVVLADGRPAVVLPRPPLRVAASTFALGDSLHVVTAGEAGETFVEHPRDHTGMAQAAFVYPVAHRTSVRVAIPLAPARRTRRRWLARRRAERLPDVQVNGLPSADDVARGWSALLRQGMRVELPDARLQEAVDANRAFLLLFHDGAEITPGPFTYHRFWFRDAAFMLAALDRWGFHRQSAEVLRSYPDRQHADGFYASQRKEWDSNGEAIWAIAEHVRFTGDTDLLRALAPSVHKGMRWIRRKRRERRGTTGRGAPGVQGLMPPGISAEHLGPYDYYYWDDFWSLRGLIDAAWILRQAGDSKAAAAAEAVAADLQAAVMRSIEMAATRVGRRVIPAGPNRGIDAGMIGSLAACFPLKLMAADDPLIAGTAATVRDSFCAGDAFFQAIAHTGLGTYLTMQLAFVELEAGDEAALARLRWLLDAATPTWTWPEAVHPRLGGGCMGDGHHGWAAADFLTFVRQLLVRETADGGLALMTLLPSGWEGSGVEVHDAPTHAGKVSYAVRWHGDRPALIWECERPGVRLTAPGLDPTWSSTEPRGEALLAPVGTPEPAHPPGTLPAPESFS